MADTRETIHARLLAELPTEYDKTVGEFVFDVTKPVAIELEPKYSELNSILDKGFAETSTGAFLELKVAEQGLQRKAAQKANTEVVIYGSEGAEIKTGDLVSSDTVFFAFTEDKIIDSSGEATVIVECIQAGTIGNLPTGAIKYFPITLPGLTGVNNPNPITNGYNAETDAELRQRYYEKVRTPATSGNKYHYRNWAKEVAGVGDARIVPIWDGPGTVKAILINSNKQGADIELIEAVAEHIEELRPIGADVTVVSAAEIEVDIEVSLTIDTDNYSESEVIDIIAENITMYLQDIAFIESYVSYAKIGSLILDSAGVLDYEALTVNSGTANISIADDEVAILGGVVNV